MIEVLGIDIGATKTAWALVDEKGRLVESGHYATPTSRTLFLKTLTGLVKTHPTPAIGIAMASTISADHKDIVVSPNLPELSHLQLVAELEKAGGRHIALDNDARCALIGEVWLGSARRLDNVVMLTIGTGVGGAVMERGRVLPHPLDINEEIGRIVVDPTDVFPTSSGRGTVEALVGGHNLEDRLQISLREEAEKVRAGDPDSVAVWQNIAHFFIQVVRVVHDHYQPRTIIIGGIGGKDLEFYLQAKPPCRVISGKLGPAAGIMGAARIALDLLDIKASEADIEEEA